MCCQLVGPACNTGAQAARNLSTETSELWPNEHGPRHGLDGDGVGTGWSGGHVVRWSGGQWSNGLVVTWFSASPSLVIWLLGSIGRWSCSPVVLVHSVYYECLPGPVYPQ